MASDNRKFKLKEMKAECNLDRTNDDSINIQVMIFEKAARDSSGFFNDLATGMEA
jgi:hypothetical protein